VAQDVATGTSLLREVPTAVLVLESGAGEYLGK